MNQPVNVSPVSPTTQANWWDFANRALSALVVILTLLMLWGIINITIPIVMKESSDKWATDMVAMVTGIGSLLTSILGLFFGISVARQGLESANQANATSSNLSSTLQTVQAQNASMRSDLSSSLNALKAQLPTEQHPIVDTILAQVASPH
jgi:hypothetical protein